jgi:hypothetical protein
MGMDIFGTFLRHYENLGSTPTILQAEMYVCKILTYNGSTKSTESTHSQLQARYSCLDVVKS